MIFYFYLYLKLVKYTVFPRDKVYGWCYNFTKSNQVPSQDAVKIKLGNNWKLIGKSGNNNAKLRLGYLHICRWINENSCRNLANDKSYKNTQICLWTRYRDIIQLFQVLISVVFHGAKNKDDPELSILCELFTVLFIIYEVQSIISPSLQMRKPFTPW